MVKSAASSPVRNTLIVVGCAILVLQAGASRLLTFDEVATQGPHLREVPLKVGPWTAQVEGSLEPDIVAYLKPDDYIIRDYSNTDGQLNLLVAYFKSLQKTYGPHAPRICLPGSGWLETSGKITSIAVPGRPAGIPLNQLTYEKAGTRILVLYWYQNDRNTWAEEFRAKLTLLPDLIRYRRSDVSLVRLVAHISEPTPDGQFARCVEFVKLLYPTLAERSAAASKPL